MVAAEYEYEIDSDSSRRTILVVGAGFGGLRFFIESLNLVLGQHRADSVEYVFVDERPYSEFGRGLAWASDQNPNMRANMQYPERDIGAEISQLAKMPDSKTLGAKDIFTQRTKIGAMLSNLFKDAIQKAEHHGVPFYPVQGEVINILRKGISYHAVLKSSKRIKADCVVLALGHIPPTTFPHLFDKTNYVRNAWTLDISQISKIPSDARVAVIGLGPSAVDTIIKLRDGGLNEIFAYSRSGTMQYPRPGSKSTTPRIMTEDNLLRFASTPADLRVDTLLGMMSAEFLVQGIDWQPFFAAVECSKRPPFESLSHGFNNSRDNSDWFGLISTFNDVIPIAWHLLDDDERSEFLRLRDQVSDVVYGMASPHALRILTELQNESLHVLGGLTSITLVEESDRFQVTRQENDQSISEEFDYIIDCTGFGKRIDISGISLLDNLLRQKFLQPHEYGGAVVNFHNGRIIAAKDVPPIHIYALTGTLNIGTRLATNGLSAVASSASRSAEAIHAYLFPDFDQSSLGQPNDTSLRNRIQEGLKRASRLGSRWRRTLVHKFGS